MNTNLKQYIAAPWVTGSPTIDFDTRLEMAAVGLDVKMSLITEEETDQLVIKAIDEAALYTTSPWLAESPVDRNATLTRAAAIIRSRGWHQGDMQAEDSDCVCAQRAIQIASGSSFTDYQDAMRVLLGRIKQDLGHGAMGVPSWNDQPTQTAEGVLRLLY